MKWILEVLIVTGLIVGYNIPYHPVWYKISSAVATATLAIVIVVAWEYLRPRAEEHQGIGRKDIK